MEDTLLTVDCGTQSLRAMLFTGAGKLVDKAKVEYEPYLSPHPGWAEQDARVYWDALCRAVQTLKARSGPAGPAGRQDAAWASASSNGAPAASSGR